MRGATREALLDVGWDVDMQYERRPDVVDAPLGRLTSGHLAREPARSARAKRPAPYRKAVRAGHQAEPAVRGGLTQLWGPRVRAQPVLVPVEDEHGDRHLWTTSSRASCRWTRRIFQEAGIDGGAGVSALALTVRNDEEVDRGLVAVAVAAAAMNLLGLLTVLLSAQGASWPTTMWAVAISPAYGGAAPAVRGVKS
jgi:hypothetical protein